MKTIKKGLSQLDLANDQERQTNFGVNRTGLGDVPSLAAVPGATYVGQVQSDERDQYHDTSLLAEHDLRRRDLRYRTLGPDLGSDLAWGILLYVLLAERQKTEASLQNISQALLIPLSTASRWVSALEHEGLIEQRSTSQDHQTALSLTHKGATLVTFILNKYP